MAIHLPKGPKNLVFGFALLVTGLYLMGFGIIQPGMSLIAGITLGIVLGALTFVKALEYFGITIWKQKK